MLRMYWPIMVLVLSDILYQIASKSTPADVSPFASLTVTYLMGAALSAILFFVSGQGTNLFAALGKINWTAFVLGLAIVGLEGGSLYMYKAGWNVNTGYVVKAIIVSVALVFVGYLVYREQITLTKFLGIAVCMLGIVLINR